MGASSFLTGLLQGNVDEATKMKKGGKSGMLRKKKKKTATDSSSDDYDIPSFKRGGKVKRTGLARVHKGERVLTKRQAKHKSKRR